MKTRAFCKTFPDGSHVAFLWNAREGLRLKMPEDLWPLPHDLASGFLRRAAGRRIPEDCAAVAGTMAGGAERF